VIKFLCKFTRAIPMLAFIAACVFLLDNHHLIHEKTAARLHALIVVAGICLAVEVLVYLVTWPVLRWDGKRQAARQQAKNQKQRKSGRRPAYGGWQR
jgi:hypothetical protein